MTEWKCPRCGRQPKPAVEVWPYHCPCGQTAGPDGERLRFWPPLEASYWRLGDWAAAFFGWLGIKEWEGCKCAKRRVQLNLLGWHLFRMYRTVCIQLRMLLHMP